MDRLVLVAGALSLLLGTGCRRTIAPPNAPPLQQDPAGPPGLTPQSVDPPNTVEGRSPETVEGDEDVPPNPIDPREADDEEIDVPETLDDATLASIVGAKDRDPEDFDADTRRKPLELLRFLRLHRGMKVADIGAGFGYTTELLARAVGPTGKVYGQNPKFVLERFAEEGWSKRLSKPALANVVRLDREFDDPFGPEVKGLDLVVNVLFYHDFEWQGVDRAAHNQAVFEALAPGGRYVIVDASAKKGAGASGSKTLHRIEEALVIRELKAAGFELARTADFLRNPDDTRDWNSLPWRNDKGEIYSDKFVLEFRKP